MSALSGLKRGPYWSLVAALLVSGCAGSSLAPSAAPQLAAAPAIVACPSLEPVFPTAEWQRIERPECAGWSAEGLRPVRERLSQMATTGFVAVVGGRVLMDYGDVQVISYLASVRKSVLSMLYGIYTERGAIDLDQTLEQLGIDDLGGLTAEEKQATVRHLLSARSGIYHAASNGGDDAASAPPRGSQRPGTYYLYNNWDFNAAGAVFEQLTKTDIYDALEADLAKPIGMQDFDRSAQRKSGNPERSQHMAYHIWLSTRDMARVGLLMLREGSWAGRQVASREWVRRISSVVTPFHEMNPPYQRSLGGGNRWGYGYMWWVWDAPNSPGPFTGAYTGKGAGGQFITVLPALDMVVAHKTDTQQVSPHGDGQRQRSVTGTDYDSILRMLAAARCPGGVCR